MNHTVTTTRKKEAMPRVKLGNRRQITLPVETVKRFKLVPGEELELISHEKMIVLVPRNHILKDQQWYHTETWQRMMQEAFEDLKAGRIAGPFESAEKLIKDLNS